MVFRHRRLTSYEAGLAISRTHAIEEVGRGSHVRLHGVDHAGAGIASNLAEVRILQFCYPKSSLSLGSQSLSSIELRLYHHPLRMEGTRGSITQLPVGT